MADLKAVPETEDFGELLLKAAETCADELGFTASDTDAEKLARSSVVLAFLKGAEWDHARTGELLERFGEAVKGAGNG